MENVRRRFHISVSQRAEAEIKRLARVAHTVGRGSDYLRVFREIIGLLKTRPLEWGDPERRTRLPGGLVCHGIREPLIIRFAVYEVERVVFFFEIEATPGSYLAEAD